MQFLGIILLETAVPAHQLDGFPDTPWWVLKNLSGLGMHLVLGVALDQGVDTRLQGIVVTGLLVLCQEEADVTVTLCEQFLRNLSDQLVLG